MNTTFKTCKTCLASKPLDLFYNHPKKKDGKFSHCKACLNAKTKKARQDPSKKHLWSTYTWRSTLKHRYGITEKDYLLLLASQNNGCAICGAALAASGQHRRLHVDHCHQTNKIRGLLCNNCNNGLGRFQHDPKLLAAAVQYLIKSP
jgi:Recombination endonuclease VII